MADNIETFNAVTGLVFSQLYSSFPVPREIDARKIATSLGVEFTEKQAAEWSRPVPIFGDVIPGMRFGLVLNATLDWLGEENFIRGNEGMPVAIYERLILTSKAMAALNANLDSIDGTLGQKLQSAAEDAATEVGRAAIGETVGQVIGAAARAFMS